MWEEQGVPARAFDMKKQKQSGHVGEGDKQALGPEKRLKK